MAEIIEFLDEKFSWLLYFFTVFCAAGLFFFDRPYEITKERDREADLAYWAGIALLAVSTVLKLSLAVLRTIFF